MRFPAALLAYKIAYSSYYSFYNHNINKIKFINTPLLFLLLLFITFFFFFLFFVCVCVSLIFISEPFHEKQISPSEIHDVNVSFNTRIKLVFHCFNYHHVLNSDLCVLVCVCFVSSSPFILLQKFKNALYSL